MVQVAPQRQPIPPQKKPLSLTLEDINRARDRRSVYGSVSMFSPKETSKGTVQEASIRVTDFPPGHEMEQYGLSVPIKVTFWGTNNPKALWLESFIEQQREWQQPDVPENEKKAPMGWMRLWGLHERHYKSNKDGSEQVSLEASAIDFTGWYGFPEDFLSSPQIPTDEELKSQKVQKQQERETAAAQVPAATLVDGDGVEEEKEYNPF